MKCCGKIQLSAKEKCVFFSPWFTGIGCVLQGDRENITIMHLENKMVPWLRSTEYSFREKG